MVPRHYFRIIPCILRGREKVLRFALRGSSDIDTGGVGVKGKSTGREIVGKERVKRHSSYKGKEVSKKKKKKKREREKEEGWDGIYQVSRSLSKTFLRCYKSGKYKYWLPPKRTPASTLSKNRRRSRIFHQS